MKWYSMYTVLVNDNLPQNPSVGGAYIVMPAPLPTAAGPIRFEKHEKAPLLRTRWSHILETSSDGTIQWQPELTWLQSILFCHTCLSFQYHQQRGMCSKLSLCSDEQAVSGKTSFGHVWCSMPAYRSFSFPNCFFVVVIIKPKMKKDFHRNNQDCIW